ncbi:hypothetical protein KFL_000630250 [Klebsormidium nitens]|uniref:Uncharacterized protein n=1 Tax=Klebsormidium nitens TaxID=105231 RepID=A0A1Y1HSN2_KLENI|nr:hypothetical protein KFL_000630250 [Klebsormidium nitens]|eukprot:GAQ80822.1 hypothetical protein KFL_000630250 [Klebsormidium nitens]
MHKMAALSGRSACFTLLSMTLQLAATQFLSSGASSKPPNRTRSASAPSSERRSGLGTAVPPRDTPAWDPSSSPESPRQGTRFLCEEIRNCFAGLDRCASQNSGHLPSASWYCATLKLAPDGRDWVPASRDVMNNKVTNAIHAERQNRAAIPSDELRRLSIWSKGGLDSHYQDDKGLAVRTKSRITNRKRIVYFSSCGEGQIRLSFGVYPLFSLAQTSQAKMSPDSPFRAACPALFCAHEVAND